MTENEKALLQEETKRAGPLTFTGEELLSEPLRPMSFIVDGLLSAGLYVIAGAPKIGKSWLVLWLCACVATGGPVWKFPTQQGTVLYYCLEDTRRRIQNRFAELAAESESDYTSLHFTLDVRSIDDGLCSEIEMFVSEHPDTRMVVIDTLQKVRGASDCAYANDYTDLTVLKGLADRLGICVLVVHHTRKQRDADPMNMISGTTGITGAADGSFVLSRESRTSDMATLTCTGRDIESRELRLIFDEANCTWNMLSDSVTDEPEPSDETIYSVVKLMETDTIFCGTATELAQRLKEVSGAEYIPSQLSKQLMKSHDELLSFGIRHEYKRTREQRTITLERLAGDGSDGSDGIRDSVATDEGLSASIIPVTGVTAVTESEYADSFRSLCL